MYVGCIIFSFKINFKIGYIDFIDFKYYCLAYLKQIFFKVNHSTVLICKTVANQNSEC